MALSTDGTIEADRVALCFGHAPPSLPCPVSIEAAADPRFVANPWRADGLSTIELDAAVLLVGTGLTMADVAVSLLSRGHRATITAVSRRGLLARPQGVFADDANFLEGIAAPTTALELLRLVRRRVRASIASGSGWHPAIDALRYNLPQIWRAMPEVERRRIARRLLPFWDVHRFRVAPAVHSVLERAICDGRLVVEKAGVTSIGVERSALMAVLRRPGGRLERRRFQGIVLCIGPERDPTRIPLVGALLAAGLARLDAVGLGLDVDAGSHLVSGDGTINPSLLAFGPMTRGAFGEMTGAPDIARHVERIVGLMASGVA